MNPENVVQSSIQSVIEKKIDEIIEKKLKPIKDEIIEFHNEVKRMKLATRLIEKQIKEKNQSNEIEIISPPIKNDPPVYELDDTPVEIRPSEIRKGSRCVTHPPKDPILPFEISEDYPIPSISCRKGQFISGEVSLILRVGSSKSPFETFQVRIFCFRDNAKSEKRWKQLQCLKLKNGVFSEQTIICNRDQMYHFTVCLVKGNFRSKFSDCVTDILK